MQEVGYELMNYAVVIEQNKEGFAAHVPDMPGCAAVGKTLEDVKQRIKAEITAHVAHLRRMGQTVPEPTTLSWHVVEEK